MYNRWSETNLKQPTLHSPYHSAPPGTTHVIELRSELDAGNHPRLNEKRIQPPHLPATECEIVFRDPGKLRASATHLQTFAGQLPAGAQVHLRTSAPLTQGAFVIASLVCARGTQLSDTAVLEAVYAACPGAWLSAEARSALDQVFSRRLTSAREPRRTARRSCSAQASLGAAHHAALHSGEGQASAGQASAGQASAGQASAGQASAGQASERSRWQQLGSPTGRLIIGPREWSAEMKSVQGTGTVMGWLVVSPDQPWSGLWSAALPWGELRVIGCFEHPLGGTELRGQVTWSSPVPVRRIRLADALEALELPAALLGAS